MSVLGLFRDAVQWGKYYRYGYRITMKTSFALEDILI